jgi:transposase
MTTKILALTDALGNLVRFVLMPGHRFDTVGVAPLIDGLVFDGFIADKAFDSNSIIADLNERGAKIAISRHPRRGSPRPDVEIYKSRHLIENFFCKLKEFKTHRPARRKNQSALRRKYPSRRSLDKFPMNLNSPSADDERRQQSPPMARAILRRHQQRRPCGQRGRFAGCQLSGNC